MPSSQQTTSNISKLISVRTFQLLPQVKVPYLEAPDPKECFRPVVEIQSLKLLLRKTVAIP